MRQGKRVDAMRELFSRVTKITSMLETSGIKVRCINANEDHRFDNIRTQKDANIVFGRIKFNGRSSRIGTGLKSRVLDPLLYEEINRGSFNKPLLIATITDGAVRLPLEYGASQCIKTY